MSNNYHHLARVIRAGVFTTLLMALCAAPSFAQKVDMDMFKSMKTRAIGPAGMSGRVTAIDAIDENPNIIYAGAASGGVWKSTSGGITWKPIFDKEKVHSIGALNIYQKNPSVIWVGTGEGNPRNSLNGGFGVYKSLDAGETWELMGLEATRNIHRIIIHPDNPDVVFVGAIGSPWGTQEERGVFKTVDGGKTWKKILYVDEKTGVGEMIMDPNNPNKIFVNMWEHLRTPDFFKSGGPSSGLYVTHNGGDDWKKLNAEDNGLPKGDLGRMGLAISKANSNKVYALIESSKNALYVSEDGGKKFSMVNDKSDIGDRPFYYFEIHANPKNENMLYTLYSRVGVSIDGGKSFQQLLPYSGVHPDHHAWYINPIDPDLIIDGNDGGLNITRDGGDTWYFAEGIPLGQWYHINVDNQMPYNIYGGLQDNGSWVGPAYVWKRGGIRNTYWQEVMFGDGFDAMVDQTDPRYGFAMSQGGNVARFDIETGHTRTIRPTHPDKDVFLRFNWNAAMAQNPHHASGIYYASQFLHKSMDRGDTWEIISPDLTTNNPELQRQSETGGLTFDITGAENNTTITAIAPSPVDENVIWVGTDDGNVQVTRDGGTTWTNTVSKMTGLPAGSWIPQIQASRYNAGEVFVIANNYRRNDFTAYVYRSKDYGQTWERIADDSKVWGYALSIIQDPTEPNLVFLGTEYGLYVSFDNAKIWNKWTHGYPEAVSTYDMAIQEREADLVIGTFGRSIYVLDDIRPLREYAKQGASLKNSAIVAVSSPDAYQIEFMQPHGERFGADALYEGENRQSFNGWLSFFINTPKEPKEDVKYDSVTVAIFNSSGEQIRTLKSKPDQGLNRMFWGLDRKSTSEVQGGFGRGGFGGGGGAAARRFFEPSGGSALPGEYKIVYTYGDQTAESSIKVGTDPRIQVNMSDLIAKDNFAKEMESVTETATLAMQELGKARTTIDKMIAYARGNEDAASKELLKASNDVKKKLDEVNEAFSGPSREGQGIVRNLFPTTMGRLFAPRGYAGSSYSAPGATELRLLDQAKEALGEALVVANEFFANDWKAYREKVESIDISLFSDVPNFKID